MRETADDGTVQIRLTRAEALVLFEWIARTDSAQAIPVEHSAEQHVLWRVEGQLESALVEVLQPDYKRAVDAARAAVCGETEKP